MNDYLMCDAFVTLVGVINHCSSRIMVVPTNRRWLLLVVPIASEFEVSLACRTANQAQRMIACTLSLANI